MGRKQTLRKRKEVLERATPAPPSTVVRIVRAIPARVYQFSFVAVLASAIASAVTYRATTAPAPMPLQVNPVRSATIQLPSLGDFVAMTDEQLAREDLAMVNLLCALGLPGAENLDIGSCLKTLDKWAATIKQETDRHLYRVRDPRFRDVYKGSEAYFRVSMMLQVLQEDLGVHYNKQRATDVDFTNSKDLFLHGLVGNKNGGTCVSMPVLYVAMGRRLGYPMKLALAKAHVYCRWEDGQEQFNIEGSGEGFASFDDDYYKKWPSRLTLDEIGSGQFLRSLTPREELAVFLAARGHCCEDIERWPESHVAYAQANLLAPNNPLYGQFMTVAVMKRHDARMIANDQRDRSLAQQELRIEMNQRDYELRKQQEELRRKQFQPPIPGYVDPRDASTDVISIPSQHPSPFVDPTIPRY